jgi:hypothetical protein
LAIPFASVAGRGVEWGFLPSVCEMMLNGHGEGGNRELGCSGSLGPPEVDVRLGLESWNIQCRGRIPSRDIQWGRPAGAQGRAASTAGAWTTRREGRDE